MEHETFKRSPGCRRWLRWRSLQWQNKKDQCGDCCQVHRCSPGACAILRILTPSITDVASSTQIFLARQLGVALRFQLDCPSVSECKSARSLGLPEARLF